MVVAGFNRLIVVDLISNRSSWFEVVVGFDGFVFTVIRRTGWRGFLVNLLVLVENDRIVICIRIYIRCTQSVKQTVAHAVRQRDVFGKVLFDIEICCRFESVFLFELFVEDFRIAVEWFNSSWIEIVINSIHAIIQLEIVADVILEIVFDVVIFDTRIPSQTYESQIQSVVIIAVNQG